MENHLIFKILKHFPFTSTNQHDSLFLNQIALAFLFSLLETIISNETSIRYIDTFTCTYNHNHKIIEKLIRLLLNLLQVAQNLHKLSNCT